MKKKENKELDEDSLFCQSLIPRMKRLPAHAKAFLRAQIENLFYQVECNNVSSGVASQHPKSHDATQWQQLRNQSAADLNGFTSYTDLVNSYNCKRIVNETNICIGDNCVDQLILCFSCLDI